MDRTVYICTGGCGAVISEKQFDEGLVVCGADGCDHKGDSFEKRMKCAKCEQLYAVGQVHIC